MTISRMRKPRAKRQRGRVTPRSIAGPCLTAVRTAYSAYENRRLVLAPVFDRVGEQLDAALADRRLELLGIDGERTIVVAISDAVGPSFVVLTSYRGQEVPIAMADALKALDSCAAAFCSSDFALSLAKTIGAYWVTWSDNVRQKMQRGAQPVRCKATDICVGSLLATSPDLREQIDHIAAHGDTPVITVALNSAGTNRERLKCKLLVLVFALPAWARSSGVVAGSA